MMSIGEPFFLLIAAAAFGHGVLRLVKAHSLRTGHGDAEETSSSPLHLTIVGCWALIVAVVMVLLSIDWG